MNVFVHYPETAATKAELQKRIADVHAAAVVRSIRKLTCPSGQKLKLINSIQADAKNNHKD